MAENHLKKIIYNYSSLGVIQVVNFLLSLMVIPYAVRKVGADGFGIIAVAQVVMYFLSVITDYGFNQTATRDIAVYKNDTQKISKIFFTVLSSRLLLCLLAFVLLIVLILVVPLFHGHFSLYLMAFAFVIGQAFLINWFFQGLEKMHYIAIIILIARLIFVGFVFTFIRGKEDISFYLFFMGLGNVIAGAISIYAAFRIFKLKFTKPTRHDIINEFKEGWQITVTNLSITSCQYIGVFILRLFTNDLIVGYYSIAEKIYFSMKILIGLFSQVIYPKVCQLVLTERNRIILFFKQTYLPFLGLASMGSALVFIFSPQILYFFIGHKHESSSFLLRVMCIATVIVCLNIPAYLVLLATNHKKSYLRIFTYGTILNIMANILLVPFFDAIGTVFSVILTELFITIGLCWELYRFYIYNKNKGKRFLMSLFHKP